VHLRRTIARISPLGKVIPARDEVIDRTELTYVLQMRQQFDGTMNPANETDEQVQRDHQETANIKADEGEPNEDESDPEDKIGGIVQELFDNHFGRDRGGSSDKILGVFDSQWCAERAHVTQYLLDTTQSTF
jgi:hypothetical protein